MVLVSVTMRPRLGLTALFANAAKAASVAIVAGAASLAGCAGESAEERGPTAAVVATEPADQPNDDSLAALSALVWDVDQRGTALIPDAVGSVDLTVTSWQGEIVWEKSLTVSAESDDASRRTEIAIAEPGYYELVVEGGGRRQQLGFIVVPANELSVPDELR